MTARPALLAVFLLAAIGLVGCNPQGVRNGSDTDATGQLGSPLAVQSPADVYIELSGAYLQEGRLDEALRNAKKAILVDPSSSNAQYIYALVQQQLGQIENAGEAYRKAVSLDPRNPDALNAYGLYLCSKQRYDEADAQFRRALTNPLYKTPWLALHNAGHCLQQADRVADAETDYRAALQRNPRFAPSLLAMSQLSFDQGIYLSARAYLQRYTEMAPHTAESLWLGIRTENQLGNRRQMASYQQELRRRFPDSEEAKYLQSIE
jgi:type IV pilus assembly protein PilF